MTTSLSFIRSCHIDSSDLGEAGVVSAQIPVVRTIFDNALAEKRAGVEHCDSDFLNSQCEQKILGRSRNTGESSHLGRSLGPTNNSFAYR